MPVNRVCQLIGDVPGSGAETGYVYARETSAIVWDRHSQKWIAATRAEEPVPVNRAARLVKATQAGNQHKSGT